MGIPTHPVFTVTMAQGGDPDNNGCDNWTSTTND